MAVGQIISRAIAQGAVTADDIGALEITHAKLHTDMDLSSKTVTMPAVIRGPATLTIDPAAVGDNTGTLVIAGNLQVDGTTTTINSTTMTVDDKNLVLASGAGNSSAADGAGITIDGASATMLYTHATTSFDFNKPVNISGDLLVSSGTSGDAKLIIESDTDNNDENDNPEILFKQDGGWETGGIRMGNNQTVIWNSIQDAFDGGIEFKTGTVSGYANVTTKMTIEQSGDVGIGDTSPDNKMNIKESALGSRSASNSNTSLTIEHATDTGIQFFSATQTQLRFGDAASTGAGSIIYTHSDNALKFNTSEALALTLDQNQKATFAGDLQAAGVYVGATNTSYDFYNNGTSYLNGDVIVDSNLSLTGGTNKLIVATDTEDVGSIYTNVVIRDTRNYNATNNGGGIGFQGKYNNGGAVTNFAGIQGVKENNTDGEYGSYLIMTTRSHGSSMAERMRIDSSGNVGIGTNNPSTRLDVRGIVGVAYDSGNHALRLYNQPRNNWSSLSNMQTGNQADLVFKSGSGTMTFTHSGNLGIGNTDPDRPLTITANSGANALALRARSNDDYAFIQFWNNAGNTLRGQIYNHNDNIGFTTGTDSSAGYDLYLKDGGNVGIGTDNPGFKLSVDNGTSDGGIFKIHNEEVGLNVSVNGAVGDYTNSERMVVFNATRYDSGTSPKLRLGGQGGIEFAVDANNVRMVINSSGNVGIGVTDPTEKLTLNVGNGGGILQSTYYSGTATSGQKLGVIGFKGYSQGNTVAGADAKIEGVAASNHSGSSAPAHLDFYTKDDSIGPGSGATRRFRIDEYGGQIVHKSKNNWSRVMHNQSSGSNIHYRLYGAGSSTTTYNLLRYRRHYWGSGSVHITLFQTYYSTTSQGEYWLTGHGRSDGSYNVSYGLEYRDIYNGPGSGRLSTNVPGGAPGNSDAEIVDVSISIPAYYYYMVKVEVSHSEFYPTTTVMGSVNSYALHA